jgi:PPP family 3-phenylpropionic acid transporter
MNIPGRPSLWMCAAYFAFYAGIACWAPYVVLFYQERGLSGAEIGILNAISPLGMAFLAPIWGYVADTRSAHRLILRVALLTTAAVALLLTGASSFWQFLLLLLVFALVGTTASPLIDSYGVTISAQQGLSFGQLRVWGSIGYTLVVWLIGYAMRGSVSRLFLLCYALALAATCAATIGLPARRRRASQSESRWQGAAAMLRRPDMRIVLLVIFLLAISTNPVFVLFGIYITELGGDTTLLGATSAIAAISEFPVMFLGSRLIKRLGSRRLLVVALVMYCLRILLYSVAPSAGWVLAVQLLHGCSFGLYLIASVTLVHELVGSELAATAQGLLASAMAFGQMSGSLIGGILLDQVGIFALYRLSAGITALALVVFALGLRRYGGLEAPALHSAPMGEVVLNREEL